MKKRSKHGKGVWRVVRPPLALSDEDHHALISSTYPLDPLKILSTMALSKSSISRARYILKRLKKVIRLLSDQSGRFVNLITLTTSISSLYELLKYFLEGGLDVPRPPDAAMFLKLLKHCRIPAKLLKIFTKDEIKL